MKLYVIRHGESETNKAKCWTGWVDALLTDKGRSDAERAGQIIGQIKFDKVFSSDLIRARETATIALRGMEHEPDILLREINLGKLGGARIDSFSKAEKSAFIKNGYADMGGESNKEFRKRIKDFLRKVETLPYENIAAFSHAGWLRGALALVLESPLAKERVICNNCAIGVFEYKNGVWKLYSWTNV